MLWESVTSHLQRVAEAHGVKPSTLLVRRIAPAWRDRFEQGRSAGDVAERLWPWFERDAYLLNGPGETGWRLATVLSELTGFPAIPAKSLRPLRPAVAATRLLARSRRFCRPCLQERADRGLEVYEPILWQVLDLQLCPTHVTRLRELCPWPDCGRAIAPLASDGRAGWCTHCHRWLGSNSDGETVSAEDAARFNWLASEVADLLVAGGPTIGREQVSSVVRSLIDVSGPGSMKGFARQIGRSPSVVHAWLNGGTPELGAWATMALAAGVRLAPLLISGSLESSPDVGVPSRTRPARRVQDWHRTRQVLRRAAQATTYVPLHTRMTAIGQNVSEVRRRESKLWRAAAARTEELRSARTVARRDAVRASLDKTVAGLLDLGAKPSRRRVEPQLHGVLIRERWVGDHWRSLRGADGGPGGPGAARGPAQQP